MVDQVNPNALRVLDNNGAPISGAKIYVYETGTTTDVTVYTDTALSAPHAQPIVADGNGYVAQIFYGGSTALKIVITDADDVTLQTLDPAPQIGVTGGAASAISFSPTGSLVSTDVQAAIEEVQANIPAGVNENANTLVTSSGTSSAFTITSPDPISAYAADQSWLVLWHIANLNAATVNVDGQGAKTLKVYNGSGKANASAGAVQTQQICRLYYDGTDMILVEPTGVENHPGQMQIIKSASLNTSSPSDAWAATEKLVVDNFQPINASAFTDASGSRAAGTSYQNTTGGEILVMIKCDDTGSGTRVLETSPDNSAWTTQSSGNDWALLVALVPNNTYYRLSSGYDFEQWLERANA